MVNGATVTATDVATSNGLIHVIDQVLTPTSTPNDIPRTAQCTGIHDSLVAAVIQAELLATLQGDGPFTLFAPTDQAFLDAGIDLAALDTPEGKTALTDILLYHVVASAVPSSAVTECMTATAVNGQPLAFTVGDGVMVNDATVTLADVNTSNGVIHVIDKVLTPTDAPNDLPRTAQCTGIHDSLVAAVIQAELLATLQGEGPFTLFAPTDQAFADAGIDLATLNTPEGKAALTDILLYHVHSGTVSASDITEGMTLQMVNGDNATLSLVGQASIDGANITLADVIGSNGVIHVIDKVLTPPVEAVEDSNDDSASSSEDESNLLTILLIVLVVIGGGAGVVLFMRNRGGEEESAKDFAQGGIMNQLQTVNPTAYATQSIQAVQPVQAVQAVQPIQTVEVIPQVVAEPVVLRQWTDEAGYTWRAMDNGETYWWTGTEWQKYA
jgi:uncharacterized surface protein with fasciclin (FAS1) repeats